MGHTKVLPYHIGLHSLAVLGPPLVDVLPCRVGAHKADGLDGWVVTDEVHRYKKIQAGHVNLHPSPSAPRRYTIIIYEIFERTYSSSCLERS